MKRWKIALAPISVLLVVLGCGSLIVLMSFSQLAVPGSDGYALYEARSRLVPIPLLLVALGAVAAYLPLRARLGWLGGVSISLGLLGLALMLGGNLVEFWLFSHQPYGQANPRGIAWGSFLLGAPVMLVGLMLLASAIERRKQAAPQRSRLLPKKP
jgi:hypothetical protein